MTTISPLDLATPRQINFLKILMYERLGMDADEINGNDFARFTKTEASTLINEWSIMPPIDGRKAPAEFSLGAPLSPDQAKTRLATVVPTTTPAPAPAVRVPSDPHAHGGHDASRRSTKDYDCSVCGYICHGINELYAHKQAVHGNKYAQGNYRSAASSGSMPIAPTLAPAPATPSVPRTPIPAKGYYAIEIDGEWKFYRVTERGSRWGTSKFHYLARQSGDNFFSVSAPERARVSAIINADPKRAQVEYGKRIGSCGMCGRSLTDPESRARGIGPDCWGRFHK